jgi:hypothetical protein
MRVLRTHLLCILLTISVYPNALLAQDRLQVLVYTSGSAPPIEHECVTSLRERSYSPVASQECLDQILATGYFDRGQFRTEHGDGNQMTLIFQLGAPQLTVSQLQLDFFDADSSALQALLEKTPGVLRQGEVYTREAELTTLNRIKNYFFLHRRRVGINSRLALNFTKGNATLTYSAIEGPPGPGAGDVEPYMVDPDCKQYVAVLDFRQSDDYVPNVLVERLMKTHFGSCFDDVRLQSDREILKKTGLFSQVDFSVGGTYDRRQVSVAIQGKPIKVENVSVKCYSQSPTDCQSVASRLELKAGDVYSRSADSLTKIQVEKILQKPHQNLWVFEDMKVLENSTLELSYGVILEREELSINGKPIVDYDGTSAHNVFRSH